MPCKDIILDDLMIHVEILIVSCIDLHFLLVMLIGFLKMAWLPLAKLYFSAFKGGTVPMTLHS